MQIAKRNLVFALTVVVLALVIVSRFDLLATVSNTYTEIQRFVEVMKVVDRLYVEKVESAKLVDGAIIGALEELDPHSIYISKDRIKAINEQFEGEFEGIGVEFVMHNKYPTIITAIQGSPSERAGLSPGDRITGIEGQSTYGITDQEVRDRLLGARGTRVKIEITRPGSETPFEVEITRDKIPIYSISAAFMIDDKTGLVKITRFARTTNDEFDTALRNLKRLGMTRLILDLRGNAGGYLEQAVDIADRFLDAGKRIVYTRGRIPNSNEDYYATGTATSPPMPLIVLIDHGSASASEIVAGAIQDWDKGLVVGQTSFGKGLVQQQIPLKDGGALRVTTARYYTPSGRLIQRSYDNGFHDYVAEGWDDDDPNANADSLSTAKPVFFTSSGRKVFGGGGISPDIVVNSLRITPTTIRLVQSQVFFEYGSDFAIAHPELRRDYDSYKEMFTVTADMIDEMLTIARGKGLTLDTEDLEADVDFLKRRIKSQIARHLWEADKYQQLELLHDNQVIQALNLVSEAAKIAGLTLDEG